MHAIARTSSHMKNVATVCKVQQGHHAYIDMHCMKQLCMHQCWHLCIIIYVSIFLHDFQVCIVSAISCYVKTNGGMLSVRYSLVIACLVVCVFI
jgi:hypothetical protein